MSERLSARAKLLYGVGDTGLSLTGSIIGAFFAIFLTDVAGIRPGLAAAAIFVGRSWDYVNDPLIGYLSDRARTRWGRRRPFLLFGSLPFAFAFAMLWWRPPVEGEWLLAVYYAIAYILYEAAATFIYMPYYTLTPELTMDYDERTSLTSYRMFFSIVGSLIAFTVPLAMVGKFTRANAPRILLMGLTFGLVSAAGMLTTFFGTRERPENQEPEPPKLLDSLRAAFENRPFIFSTAIYLLTWMAVTLVEANLLYFITYVVRRSDQSNLIMATVFVVAMFALPLWEWASRNMNKRLAYIIGIAFWAVVQIVLVTLGPATPVWIILALAALAGIGISAAHVIPWAIIPDAIEWDELQTGERHEGMFYSLVVLAKKIATSVALPLALLLLDATGYVPNAEQQVPSAVMGIRTLTGPIPALLLCGGIAFALLYRLTRERHAEVRQELAQRKAAHAPEEADMNAAAQIEVRPVRGWRDRRVFLTFPWRIYRDDPLWVPPLLPDRAKVIDPQRGAFFKRGEAELYIAWRGSEPVGTICAGEDHHTNDFMGQKNCIFGFFEYIADYAVFEALLRKAQAWGEARGLDALFGPFNLDYEDSYGVLIEGRDRPPVMLCGHTPPYYLDYLLRFGFVPPRADNIAFAVDITHEDPSWPKLARLADRIRARKQFVVRPANLDDWDAEVDRVFCLINIALAHLEGNMSWQRDALEGLLEPFRKIADPELILFADDGEKTVGFFPGIANANEVLKHINGLRYPWDYARLLWHMRKQPDCLSIKSVLVLPEYWNTGIAILLFDEMVKRAQARGFKWIDLSITSADNPATPVLAERLGGTIYKRWRVYRYEF